MSVKTSTFAVKRPSKCIRNTLHPRKLVFSHHERSFSARNYYQPPFASPRKRRRILFSILGQHRFTTSSTFQEPYSSSSSSSSSDPRPLIPWPKSTNPSPYEIFNLPRTATPKEIKSRYFQLVKQYHPDHAPSRSQTFAVERFRKVVEAYKILSNPLKRQEYDHQHPLGPAHTEYRHPGASEYRKPWSGSRLSRRKTEQKGPPPTGRWSFNRPPSHSPTSPFPPNSGRTGYSGNSGYSRDSSDADNSHFNYESHYKRNLEQEMKIKRRMDELHSRRMEYESEKEKDRQSVRMGFIFSGGLFLVIVLVAKAMVPS